MGRQGDETFITSMDSIHVNHRDEASTTDAPKPEGASHRDTPQTTTSGSNSSKRRFSGAEQKRRRKAKKGKPPTGTSGSTTSGSGSAPVAKPLGKEADTARVNQGGKTKKRSRSDGSGNPSPNPRKKGCIQAGQKPRPAKQTTHHQGTRRSGSYKEAAERHLRVAIINRTNPLGKITQEESDLLEQRLGKDLDEHLFSLAEEITPPTFKGWQYHGQILRITCENSQSLEWLKKAVGNFPPLWEAARLDVVQVDELPRLKKAALWIPGPPDEMEIVLKRLAAQNLWAKVNEWCLFHEEAKQEPQGRLLVFGVNQTAEAAILSKGSKLNYKFAALTIRVQKTVESTPDSGFDGAQLGRQAEKPPAQNQGQGQTTPPGQNEVHQEGRECPKKPQEDHLPPPASQMDVTQTPVVEEPGTSAMVTEPVG